MVSSWGGMAPPKDLSMVKPIERVLRSGLFGVWDAPDIGSTSCPPGLNPARHPAWGEDSFLFFPNFMLLIWKPNWYLTYHYWPTSYNTHIFEGTLYFVPPKNAYERLQQELAVVTFKEYGLQDGNTLEATQTMLESRAVTEFPLSDQEVLLRHLHTTARGYVADYQSRTSPARRSASRPRPDRGARRCRPPLPCRTSPTSSRSPTGPCPPRSATATPSASRARWTSSRRSTTPRSRASKTATEYLKGVELDGISERGPQPAVAVRVAGDRVVPGRGVAPAPRARQRRVGVRRGRRTGHLTKRQQKEILSPMEHRSSQR